MSTPALAAAVARMREPGAGAVFEVRVSRVAPASPPPSPRPAPPAAAPGPAAPAPARRRWEIKYASASGPAATRRRCMRCGEPMPVGPDGRVGRARLCPACRDARARGRLAEPEGPSPVAAARPSSVACERCGETFAVGPLGPVPRWCPACRAARARERDKEAKRRRRGAPRPAEAACARCGEAFAVGPLGPVPSLCPACRDARARELRAESEGRRRAGAPARPAAAACERCGATFAVGPRGHVPRWCPACRAAREREQTLESARRRRAAARAGLADAPRAATCPSCGAAFGAPARGPVPSLCPACREALVRAPARPARGHRGDPSTRPAEAACAACGAAFAVSRRGRVPSLCPACRAARKCEVERLRAARRREGGDAGGAR